MRDRVSHPSVAMPPLELAWAFGAMDGDGREEPVLTYQSNDQVLPMIGSKDKSMHIVINHLFCKNSL